MNASAWSLTIALWWACAFSCGGMAPSASGAAATDVKALAPAPVPASARAAWLQWRIPDKEILDGMRLSPALRALEENWARVMPAKSPFRGYELGKAGFPHEFKAAVDRALFFLGNGASSRVLVHLRCAADDWLNMKNFVRLCLVALWHYESIFASSAFWAQSAALRDEMRECAIDVLELLGTAGLHTLRSQIAVHSGLVPAMEAEYSQLTGGKLESREKDLANQYHSISLHLLIATMLDIPLYAALARMLPNLAHLTRLDAWAPFLWSTLAQLRGSLLHHFGANLSTYEDFAASIAEMKRNNGHTFDNGNHWVAESPITEDICYALAKENSRHHLPTPTAQRRQRRPLPEVYHNRIRFVGGDGEPYPTTLYGITTAMDDLFKMSNDLPHYYQRMQTAVPEGFRNRLPYRDILLRENIGYDWKYPEEFGLEMSRQLRERTIAHVQQLAHAELRRLNLIDELIAGNFAGEMVALDDARELEPPLPTIGDEAEAAGKRKAQPQRPRRANKNRCGK